MIHEAESAVERQVDRPVIGVLSVEAVVPKLAADVERKTVVVCEIVLENDAETKARNDVERVYGRQDGIYLRMCKVLGGVVLGLAESVGNGGAEADIHLRIVGGVVFAQRMPVDNVVHKGLGAVERVGQEAEYGRIDRGPTGIGPGEADLMRIGKIIAEDGLVVEREAVVALVVGEGTGVLAHKERGTGLPAEEPALTVLVRSEDGLGGKFVYTSPKQNECQNDKIFTHRCEFVFSFT